MEGSHYAGYWVRDELYFGENTHFGMDAIEYTFGCAKEETNYFYTQAADGILGMMRRDQDENLYTPIYEVLYERKLIEKRMFSLCLGKNGGYMQMGGFDS